MSDRTSFYYDPIRQGYDTNSWRTLSGAPAIIAGGRLSVDSGSAIHYGDILKGDISFNVNVPVVPGVTESRSFGLSAPNTSAYILFAIGSTLICRTSDGTTSVDSAAIAWDPNWTSANIVFRIRWEAGTAKFFINGSQVYAITGDSVPAGPLSLYLQDDSATAMSFGDFNIRGTQSFVMNLKTSDSSSFDGLMFASQLVTVSENVTMATLLTLPWNGGNLSENVTVSDTIADLIRGNGTTGMIRNPIVNEAVTISENISLIRV